MEFQHRVLNAISLGEAWLLDAVAEPAGEYTGVRWFFRSGLSSAHLGQNDGPAKSIGGGLMVSGRVAAGAAHADIPLTGLEGRIALTQPEHEVFAGLNTALAVRNGESAEVVLDWLAYHATHHGLQAALIIDRARPGAPDAFVKTLSKARIKGLKQLMVLQANIPLGRADAGPEADPFHAPDAPGKDRMTPPDADPWRSQFGEVVFYEMMRRTYLGTARAVMNIDVFDLLAPHSGVSVFDAAVASERGIIALEGMRAFPWTVNDPGEVGFGDHICRRFDGGVGNMRWCVAPGKTRADSVWRLVRIVGANPDPEETHRYYRFMALRHPTNRISEIVPKTSLIEDETLLTLSTVYFGTTPQRVPAEKIEAINGRGTNRTAIITTMKNEGPFILEWLAYHRALGVEKFLVYTNDCDDGTDTMFDVLQAKGIVEHRDNPFREMELKPQHAALQAAEDEPMIAEMDWVICMDVDEFMNIHVGEGRLKDLFAALPDVNMISMTWRLFGNSDVHGYSEAPILQQFTRCAPKLSRKPHQAWGFKTLFRHIGLFKKFGVHRPKGLKPQLVDMIRWVNGSGKPMPKSSYRNAWRSTAETYGYDLVTLNHYAVRSAESFLVKRDRGRVNHVDRDQGLAYWFRMNNNAERDRSIQRMIPAMQAELDKLMADPEIAEVHHAAVKWHREKIAALKSVETNTAFYQELTGTRLERLSRMHIHFGANVFLAGPTVIPPELHTEEVPDNFFFTVEKKKTSH